MTEKDKSFTYEIGELTIEKQEGQKASIYGSFEFKSGQDGVDQINEIINELENLKKSITFKNESQEIQEKNYTENPFK